MTKRRAITITLTVATVAALSSFACEASGDPRVGLQRTPHEARPAANRAGPGRRAAHDLFHGRCFGGHTEYRAPRGRRGDSTDSRKQRARKRLGDWRGARPQIAGRNGRVYVIWFGSRARSGDSETMPVFFSRLNNSGKAFEPQRNLMQYAKGGDGGIFIAADADGAVYAGVACDGCGTRRRLPARLSGAFYR